MSKSVATKPKQKAFTNRADEPELTDVETYDVNNMVFSEIQNNSVPDSIIKYKRLSIGTRYRNGQVGDLILPTERLFSFGIQENTDPNDKSKVTGHSLALCLWGKDGPTDAERAWYDKFLEIVEHIRTHMFENRDELELYELKYKEQLERINPLYYKKEKGKVIESQAPVLSAKLISFKPKEKDKNKDARDIIRSMLFDVNGNKLDAYEMIGRKCHARAAVKVESVYIGGGKYVLQLKLHDAVLEPSENSMKPLIARPVKSAGLLVRSSNPTEMKVFDDDDEQPTKQQAGSVENSDDEDAKPVVKEEKPVAKPQRKVVKAVKKQ